MVTPYGHGQTMWMTIVRFDRTADPIDPGTAGEMFGQNASSYLDVPGLLFKAYLHSEDGTMVGGAYWWADRESAEAKFNDAWRTGMQEKYGTDPDIEWLVVPVAVDPRTGVVHHSD